MSNTDQLFALKEAARGEIELLGELRRSAFEQNAHSFRWLTASLLAINGGAAISALNSQFISSNSKVISGGFFVGGILATLMVGVLGQRATIKSLLPIQRQIGYWLSVASDGTRDESLEKSLAAENAPALRLSNFGQALGWVAALLFLCGLATLGTDLLHPNKGAQHGQSACDNEDGSRGSH